MTNQQKHIVCFSGGHSSGLVAIEVVRKFGKENVVLLNSDISSKVELPDVKRFKKELAEYLDIDITYANHSSFEEMTPVDVCVEAGTWVSPKNRAILCTHRLKTAPAYEWYKKNYRSGDVIYFGFDANEQHRITRRSALMGGQGYSTDYPLALWDRTIFSTDEIGISGPQQYDKFKHANCIGCLKAGWQHWYVVYCEYPEIWRDAKIGEEKIGYPIHGYDFLEDKEEQFKLMKVLGVVPTEKIQSQTWWAEVKSKIKKYENGVLNLDLFDLPTFEPSVECTGDCRL